MKDMPKSVVKWYKWWIIQFPESWNLDNLERFYMFVDVLLTRARKERSRFWLEENLKNDCRKLSGRDIKKYCEIYEHLKNFKRVWKSHQAKLICQSEWEKELNEARKKYQNDVR